MRAVQVNGYGGNEVWEVNKRADTPTFRDNQLLVKVDAAGINPSDLAMRSGWFQKMAPLTWPVTMGGDLAGRVKAKGRRVTGFKVGDEVFGQAIVLNGGSGAWAQVAAVNSRNLALKPKTINFREAGVLPLVGTSAVQALEDHIKLRLGHKILIHGGAGGIGHIAIQLAKALGAFVATTASTDDRAFVTRLGADEVIDYRNQDFEKQLSNFDAVLDTVGGDVTVKSVNVLKKGGVLVSMRGQPDEALTTEAGVVGISQQTRTTTQRLQREAELADKGMIKVMIDREYPLDQIKNAAVQQENHSRGKIGIKVIA